MGFVALCSWGFGFWVWDSGVGVQVIFWGCCLFNGVWGWWSVLAALSRSQVQDKAAVGRIGLRLFQDRAAVGRIGQQLAQDRAADGRIALRLFQVGRQLALYRAAVGQDRAAIEDRAAVVSGQSGSCQDRAAVGT